MTPGEFDKLYPLMAGWLKETRAAHSRGAHPVASLAFPRLQHYFAAATLAKANVVLIDRVPMPTLYDWGMKQFADFEFGDFNGVTYQDTIFLKRAEFGNEALHFHELVHVIQWRFLGPKLFLYLYANGLERYGYKDNPLEVMAYVAEAAFSSSSRIFDAEDFVAERLETASLE